MFKSIDELDKFSFDDCVLGEIEKAEDGLIFYVSALIVKPNNSQNTNFTESYAGDTKIFLEGAGVESLVKSGYKYYDANGVLIKTIPDEVIPKPAWESLIKTFSGNYLPSLSKEGDKYVAEIEMVDEDGSQGDTYVATLSGKTVTITWEKYLNRVQR